MATQRAMYQNSEVQSAIKDSDVNITSQIFSGWLRHTRLKPTIHDFTYPIYTYAFDLDELPYLSKTLSLFSYNKRNLISIFDSDYLKNGPGSIKDKLSSLLAERNITDPLGRVILVTSCRILGYVFNPVSFYYCYCPQGNLLHLVTEINNTFSERHIYIVSKNELNDRASISKAFHVSPFFDRSGTYSCNFGDILKGLDIRMRLEHDKDTVFTARFWGKGVPLTSRSHLSLLARYPLSGLLTLPRIYWQAIRLFFQKRLPVYPKPNVSSPDTILATPYSWMDKLCIAIAQKALRNVSSGNISVIFPDGQTESFGDIHSSDRATIQLHNFEPFRKFLFQGGIGLGESFTAGDWSTPDLPALMKFFLNNWSTFDESKLMIAIPLRFLQWIGHLFRFNSLRGSEVNIQAHYDLGNSLFEKFLDSKMVYSSAIYEGKDDSLESAQTNKIRTLIKKAHIEENHSVLEIGSGWGAFAIEASRTRQCRVHSITLSKEQLSYAQAEAEKEGLSKNVTFELCDYRKVKGTYDRIVSIEMIEAVGKKYLPSFFETIERALNPNGIVVLQAIVFPDQWYANYNRRADWIQKYIFPGSHLPSLSALLKAIKENSRLIVEDIENISEHYARTLSDWRKRFLSQRSNLMAIGYDERFQKIWDFYLASCEAEFSTRWLQVHQIVLTRPNNRYLMTKSER